MEEFEVIAECLVRGERTFPGARVRLDPSTGARLERARCVLRVTVAPPSLSSEVPPAGPVGIAPIPGAPVAPPPLPEADPSGRKKRGRR